MAILKTLIKICLFGFLVLAGFQAQAADKCANANKQKYLKLGDFESAPGQRIIRFKQLRDDLKSSLEKGDADLSQCLYDLYDKSAQDEAGFWQAKAAAEGCDLDNPKECPDPETPRSLKFLENLHKELESSLKEDVAKLPKTEAGAGCEECEAAANSDADDQAALAQYLQHDQCCGTKEAKLDGEIGVVRQHYPGLSYNQCLAKTDKNAKATGLQTAGSCIAGLVTNIFKGMFDGVLGFFKLPGELIAARAQIWAIITDSDERARFFEHIKNSVLEFIGVQSGDLTNCLNGEAKTKYYCENAGEVIGFLASPALIGNIFKIAKLGVKAAAAAMKTALSSTAKGAAMLAKMNKVIKVAETVGSKAKALGTGAKLVGMTIATSKIAKVILKLGSPFTRGAANAYKILAPVARVGGKVIALPSKITDKAIVAGFNAGKKVVANIAAKKGAQVITASTAATGAAATTLTGATGTGAAAAGTTPGAASVVGGATAGDAAATTGKVATSTAPPTMAHGAPLEPVTPTSMSGKPTTITVSGRNGGGSADVAGGNGRTYVYKPGGTQTSAPSANPQTAVGMQPSGVQVLPRVKPTTANPTGNPYVGTPARNLRVNLTGTNSQIARIEEQLAANPTDAALLQRKADLVAKRDMLDEALAPKPRAPTPAERVNSGDVQLFQGTPTETATTPQVRAAERNVRTRVKRGGQSEASSYIAGERKRLNDLLNKYDKEMRDLAGEAADVRAAKMKEIEAKQRTARQQLDALNKAERNNQHRVWEAQEAGQ